MNSWASARRAFGTDAGSGVIVPGSRGAHARIHDPATAPAFHHGSLGCPRGTEAGSYVPRSESRPSRRCYWRPSVWDGPGSSEAGNNRAGPIRGRSCPADEGGYEQPCGASPARAVPSDLPTCGRLPESCDRFLPLEFRGGARGQPYCSHLGLEKSYAFPLARPSLRECLWSVTSPLETLTRSAQVDAAFTGRLRPIGYANGFHLGRWRGPARSP